jgi:hypothetical protein
MGKFVFSSSEIAGAAGTEQSTTITVGGQTTSTAPYVLTVGGTGAASTNNCNNFVGIGIGGTIKFLISARDVDSGANIAAWELTGLYNTSSGVAYLFPSSLAAVVAPSISNGTAWTAGTNGVSITADNINFCPKITVTAPNADHWNWSATEIANEN